MRGKALFIGLVLAVAAPVGHARAEAEAGQPIRFHYVASGVGGDVIGWVAARPTPVGHVAPGGGFSFPVEGSTATLHVEDALPPGTPIGMTVSTTGDPVRRLCVPNGTSLTVHDLTDGERLSVSMDNYDAACLGLGYQEATAGVVTVWP